MTNVQCPSCGAQASGKFCRQCGAALGQDQGPRCARCGAARPESARFCPSCGASSQAGSGLSGNERLRWFAAGGAVVAIAAFGVLALSRNPSFTPSAAPAQAPIASGAAEPMPDLSTMTPRERFDRLFNRIMRSAESGDEGSVATFAPMAMQAYGMLDSVDADARYHAALIMLHTGDVAGASAMADTISKKQPGHLFATVIRGTIARFEKNQKALDAAYAEFLKNYDKEKAAGRPEYEEHPRALQDFLESAKAAKPNAS